MDGSQARIRPGRDGRGMEYDMADLNLPFRENGSIPTEQAGVAKGNPRAAQVANIRMRRVVCNKGPGQNQTRSVK